jgi:hypothetical protein
MKEYNLHLEEVKKMFNNGNSEFYEADSYPWRESIRKFHPLRDWASTEKAETYLKKYWLEEEEYLNKWKPKQDKIFTNQNSWFPDMMIKPEFLILPIIGGKVFWESIPPLLNNSLKEIGETSIVCIQNTFNDTYSGLPFRLKYPVGIKWEELNIGHCLTDDLLIGIDQDFYVFGENENWGMYSATRALWPVNILAFNPEYASVFFNHFREIKLQEEYLGEFLPIEYQKRMPVGAY